MDLSMSQNMGTWQHNLSQKQGEEPGWASQHIKEHKAWIQTFVQLSSNRSAMNTQESSTDDLTGYCDAAKFERLFLA